MKLTWLLPFLISVSLFGNGFNSNLERLALIRSVADSVQTDLPEGEKPVGYKYPGRAMIYSGLIPGLGEVYSGAWKRGLIFAGIEVASWVLWNSYDKKGEDATAAYEDYADEHWAFSRWISDYYKWENDDEFKFLFSKAEGESLIYDDIWEGSHSLQFYFSDYWVEGDGTTRLMSTNAPEFQDIFYNGSIYIDPNTGEAKNFSNMTKEEIDDFISLNENFNVVRDGAYYENVGKYNVFFAGWDDNDSLSVFDNSGYYVAKSPNKWHYRSLRDDANNYQKLAKYMISAVMMNHVASMVDAIFTTRDWNYKLKSDISAGFNPDSKYGIGSVSVGVTLNW